MNKWRDVRIKEIGKVVAGGTPSTKVDEYWDGEIGWITPKDLSNYNSKYISNGSRNITLKGLKKSSAKLMPKGSILMTSRAPIGYLAIANDDISANQGFKNIVCNEEIVNNEFLYYYLKANIEYIKLFSSGATFPEISGSKFKKIKIRIPNLQTQEKIAGMLSTYDRLIENNNRRIEILEKTAEEIYKEWFVRMRFPGYENTKFVKGIPEEWEVKKVRDLVNRLHAGHFYKEEELLEEGEVIVIDQSTKEYMGFHNEEPTHIAGIDNPIILFGDHSCKMLVMTRQFSLGENVIPFISNNKQPALFLYYSLKGLIQTEEYKRHWKELINKKVFYPELWLQEKFRDNIKNNINLIEKYKKQNQNLIKQRDLLLPRLMNGTIEVK